MDLVLLTPHKMSRTNKFNAAIKRMYYTIPRVMFNYLEGLVLLCKRWFVYHFSSWFNLIFIDQE